MVMAYVKNQKNLFCTALEQKALFLHFGAIFEFAVDVCFPSCEFLLKNGLKYTLGARGFFFFSKEEKRSEKTGEGRSEKNPSSHGLYKPHFHVYIF